MMRAGEQSGLTLIELLVTMAISVIVFGAVLTTLDFFQHDNVQNQQRNEAQDNARTAVDALSLALRNVASPASSSTTAGALERSQAYDLVFQTVSPSQTFGGSNSANLMRVRYCLDNSTPSSETLWEQIQTWASSSAPAIPDVTACPGLTDLSSNCPTTPPVAGKWCNSNSKQIVNVTNENGGQNRALFTYNSGTTSNVNSVEADVFINPTPSQSHPGETEIKSAIDLRNSISPPTAAFVVTPVSGHLYLNASSSTDPNGESLSYQWYKNGTCTQPNTITGATSLGTGATTQIYDSGNGYTIGTNYTFILLVTNTAGLSNCTSQTVTYNG